MKQKLTSLFIAFSILFSTTLTSCLGSFTAFNNLKDWNQIVTDNKFVNNLIFWGLNIIPVYGLFLAGDTLIFNLVEFWTGDNPLALKDGEVQKQNIALNGQNYEMTATKNKMTVADESGVIISELFYDAETKTWLVSENEQTRKVLTFTDLKGDMASYKIYNSECSEGQVFTMNAKDLDFSKGVTVW